MNELCVWDAESGQLIGSLLECTPGHINALLPVDNDIWGGAEDGTLKSWNIMVWLLSYRIHS